jgi:hypothetical protein
MYHDFLEEASHHRFEGQGYLHEKPDLVLLANPGLDFFFDSWTPTVAALRDAGYMTVVTGGNLDQSRRHHNLILQALGVKIALRLRTSRFGLLHRSRQVKNHNLMAFKGPAPLPPSGPLAAAGHPRTEEDFGDVRRTLRRLGVVLEAESLARARTERLKLLNDSSVRSTVSCCSDCGDGGGGRATYVSIAKLFGPERAWGGSGSGSGSGGGGGSGGGSDDGHECGTDCGHSPKAAAAGGKSATSAEAPASNGWHCVSFRKTDKGILMVEE